MGTKKSLKLEEKINNLLDKAIEVMQTSDWAINLYASNPSYKVIYKINEEGIIRYQKDKLPNGDPITKQEIITMAEFLDWMHKQVYVVKQKIYRNLIDYINTASYEKSDPADLKYLRSIPG